jgi:hypothetical protein
LCVGARRAVVSARKHARLGASRYATRSANPSQVNVFEADDADHGAVITKS